MPVLRVADLTPEQHQGLPVTLEGEFKVPGTLHWNKPSQRWELSIPRPNRKDQRPHRLWLSANHDSVATIDPPDGGAP